MNVNTIKCEVTDVKTETGTCPGIARTQKGEVFLIAGRTSAARPENRRFLQLQPERQRALSGVMQDAVRCQAEYHVSTAGFRLQGSRFP